MMNYAIIGGGRLARHFSEYFRLLEIPHSRWTRDRRSSFNSSEIPDAEQRLRETVRQATRVLLLVSDDAIASLPRQYPFLHDKQLIHCSGAVSLPGVAGFLYCYVAVGECSGSGDTGNAGDGGFERQ